MFLRSLWYPFQALALIGVGEPIPTLALFHSRSFGEQYVFSSGVRHYMTAQTPRSELHSALAQVFWSVYRPTFLLRTTLPFVWEQFLFRPLHGSGTDSHVSR